MSTITYARDCWWCKPSTAVREVTVESVEDAPNSDKLAIVRFNEIGYQTLVTRGLLIPGDRGIFIPGESLLPVEMAETLKLDTYLSKGRVKTIKLRGNFSEGIFIQDKDYQPYAGQILKWEDPPYLAGVQKAGKRTAGQWRGSWIQELFNPVLVNPAFSRFYDMPNLKNDTKIFAPGTLVAVSEKIHGMNARFGVLPVKYKWWARLIAMWLPKLFPPTRLFIGSRNMILDPQRGGPWQDAYREFLKGKLQPGYVYFGEVFGRYNGKPIQHLTYSRSRLDLRIFMVYDAENETYLVPSNFAKHCGLNGISTVQFTTHKFESLQQMVELAEAPSEYTKKHHREGIVIVSEARYGVMAKVISATYLASNNRTEGKE